MVEPAEPTNKTKAEAVKAPVAASKTKKVTVPTKEDATPPAAVKQQPATNTEQIVREAARNHGINEDYFVKIAICESTLDPNAVNYNYAEIPGHHPSGLFQHLSNYWDARAAEHGYAGASVFDPVANANVTAAMWSKGASNLWECQ